MKIHIAQPGETLTKLARKYRVDLAKLAEANSHVKSEEPLAAGVKIRIPTKGIKVAPKKEKTSKGDPQGQAVEALAEPAAIQTGTVEQGLSGFRGSERDGDKESELPPQFHRHHHWEEEDGDAEGNRLESDGEFASEYGSESGPESDDLESDDEFFPYPYTLPYPVGLYQPFLPFGYFAPIPPIYGIVPAGWYSPYIHPPFAFPAALMPQPYLAQPAAASFPLKHFELNEWAPEWDETDSGKG